MADRRAAVAGAAAAAARRERNMRHCWWTSSVVIIHMVVAGARRNRRFGRLVGGGGSCSTFHNASSKEELPGLAARDDEKVGQVCAATASPFRTISAPHGQHHDIACCTTDKCEDTPNLSVFVRPRDDARRERKAAAGTQQQCEIQRAPPTPRIMPQLQRCFSQAAPGHWEAAPSGARRRSAVEATGFFRRLTLGGRPAGAAPSWANRMPQRKEANRPRRQPPSLLPASYAPELGRRLRRGGTAIN